MADIDSIIDAQAARAEDYAASAESEMRAAMAAAAGYSTINAPTISWQFNTTQSIPTVSNQSVTARFIAPTKPGAFDKTQLQYINPVDALNVGAVPDLDIDNLFQYALPQFNTSDTTGNAPEIDFDKIDDALAAIVVPVINDVASPELSTIVIGALPDVTVPSFATSVSVTAPDDLEDVAERFQLEYDKALPAVKAFVDENVARYVAEYAPGYSDGLAALETKLTTILENGTIVPETYETNLYAKARRQAELEHVRVASDIENAHRKRGFVIPPASMMSGIAQAKQLLANALASQSSDIAIKSAERSVQEMQFALSTSAQLRESMRTAFIQYAGVLAQLNAQADDHAKTIGSFLIDSYRATLDRMGKLIDLLRTEAAIYETALKASLAKLDIYKLELEGLKLTAEVDSLRVEAFAKKIAAEQSRIEMFVALLKSVETRANVEMSKVNVYGESVKAYVAKLSSEEIKNKIYLSALQGDELKMKGQLSKLDAFSKEVDAEYKRVSAQVDIEKLKGFQNSLLLDVYKNDLDTYKTELGAAEAVFEGDLKGQMAVIDAYLKNLDAKLNIYRVEFDRNKIELDKAETQAQINTNVAIKNADMFMSHLSLKANIAKDISGVYASMTGSALSSQNTMVQQAVT